MTERMLKPSEAADFLRVSRSTLNQWRMVGKGPAFVKVNRRLVLYRESELIAWLNRHTMGAVANA